MKTKTQAPNQPSGPGNQSQPQKSKAAELRKLYAITALDGEIYQARGMLIALLDRLEQVTREDDDFGRQMILCYQHLGWRRFDKLREAWEECLAALGPTL